MTHDTTGARTTKRGDLILAGPPKKIPPGCCSMGVEQGDRNDRCRVCGSLAGDTCGVWVSWADQEIPKLHAENAALRQALKPFAKAGELADGYRISMRQKPLRDDMKALHPFVPNIGDLRRAARALKETGRE